MQLGYCVPVKTIRFTSKGFIGKSGVSTSTLPSSASLMVCAVRFQQLLLKVRTHIGGIDGHFLLYLLAQFVSLLQSGMTSDILRHSNASG
jgi:hypothetical protein